jgi:hypothetical protein
MGRAAAFTMGNFLLRMITDKKGMNERNATTLRQALKARDRTAQGEDAQRPKPWVNN